MQNNQLVPYDFRGNTISVFPDEQGNPWFIAKEVCDVLGIKDYQHAAKEIDDDDRRTINVNEILGWGNSPNLRYPYRICISESGLSNLAFASRKSEARTFKKWLTSEVLPNISKHGYHIKKHDDQVTDYVQMMQKDISSTKDEVAVIRNDFHKFATVMIQAVQQDVAQPVEQTVSVTQDEPLDNTYYGVLEFFRFQGMKSIRRKGIDFSKKINTKAQERDIEIMRKDCVRFPYVNTYPAYFLTACLSDIRAQCSGVRRVDP